MACKAQAQRLHQPPASSIARPVLQRKCGCGRAISRGGECSACRKRRQALQRRAKSAAAVREAPPVVAEALRSPGQPLDSTARSAFEQGFGRDFSRVRVHTDARAAESAQAVRALAYTVGQDIVFGAGQYQPHTNAGLLLLAHELTHTVQQRGAAAQVPDHLEVAPAHDAAEQEAATAAETLVRSHFFEPVIRQPIVLARADAVCGPDITPWLIRAVDKTRTTFAGWTDDVKGEHCEALTSVVSGLTAWEIDELHNQGWLGRYKPECATGGPNDACETSVWVQNACYYAGSVNYVVYGVMMRLCHDYYDALVKGVQTYLDPPDYLVREEKSFEEGEMLDSIKMYKGKNRSIGITLPIGILLSGGAPIHLGYQWRAAASNFADSQAWAAAGYRGWPLGGSTPGGDRTMCTQCTALNYLDGRSPERLPHHTKKDGTLGYSTIGTGEFSIHWVYKKWAAGWKTFKEQAFGSKEKTDLDEYFGGGDPDWHPDPKQYGL